ncbi:MAG: hypothetical protein JWN72_2677 [Thermoleophilia bacterium]|nr:hypothetical protein [Thermoleophilia bacterium]
MPTSTTGHVVTTEPNTQHVEVLSADGTHTIATSDRGHVLHETGIQDRWYIPVEDVHVELTASNTTSHCPFKGDASYWTPELGTGNPLTDAAWSYEDPKEAAHAVKGAVSFWGDKVQVLVDGEPVTI